MCWVDLGDDGLFKMEGKWRCERDECIVMGRHWIEVGQDPHRAYSVDRKKSIAYRFVYKYGSWESELVELHIIVDEEELQEKRDPAKCNWKRWWFRRVGDVDMGSDSGCMDSLVGTRVFRT